MGAYDHALKAKVKRNVEKKEKQKADMAAKSFKKKVAIAKGVLTKKLKKEAASKVAAATAAAAGGASSSRNAAGPQ